MKRSRLILAATGLILFMILAIHIQTNGAISFDAPVCRAIYAARDGALTFFFTIITYLANWQTISLLCIVMLLVPGWRRTYGFPLTISALASTFFYYILKAIYQRPRPEPFLHLITEGGYSFPSGHTVTAFIFYGMMIYLLHNRIKAQGNKKSRALINGITVLLSVLIFLIALSRVYLGVHYPSDILAGFGLGTLLLIALIETWERYGKLLLPPRKTDGNTC